MFTKVCSGFFLFCLDIECAETRSFLIFPKKSRSKKKKKIPEHPFVEIVKSETCARYQLKMFNSVVLRARKSFKFFSNKPGFSKTTEFCLNFYM